jgi:hypothetical protein
MHRGRLYGETAQAGDAFSRCFGHKAQSRQTSTGQGCGPS